MTDEAILDDKAREEKRPELTYYTSHMLLEYLGKHPLLTKGEKNASISQNPTIKERVKKKRTRNPIVSFQEKRIAGF